MWELLLLEEKWDAFHLWRFANFGRSDRNVPFHLTKLMCPVPLFCFLLTWTITKLAVAWVGSMQPEPCTASSQALSVSAFRWRIRDARTARPETHRPRDRGKFFNNHYWHTKVSNTFMRVPNRVLQSRNLGPNFGQSRNPEGYFGHPVSPHSFNPESRPRFALKSWIVKNLFLILLV